MPKSASSSAVDAISDFWEHDFGDDTSPIKRLYQKLLVVSLAVTRDSEIWSRSFGLTRGEMAVLMALFRSGEKPVRPTDLLLLLSMSSSGTTKQIFNLEQRGLLARKTNPDHKGGFLVSLTDEGKALARRVREPTTWWPVTEALARLSPIEQKNAEALLNILVDAAHLGSADRNSRSKRQIS